MNKLACLAVFAVAFGLVACDNIGNAPAGMSKDDVNAAVNKMTPEQKIKFYQSSPMPQAEKEKKIAEIKKEAGLK